MRSLACVAYCLCLVLAVAKASRGAGYEDEFWCPKGCCWREIQNDKRARVEGSSAMHLECVSSSRICQKHPYTWGPNEPNATRESYIAKGMSNEECVSKNTEEGLFAQIHFASWLQKGQAT